MERIPVVRRRGISAWVWLLLLLVVLVALYFFFMRGDTGTELTEALSYELSQVGNLSLRI
jgi:hypothetical protein